MSAPEAVATPVAAVEEVKPAETVPTSEPSVPAVEVSKPEEVVQSSDVTKVEPAQENAVDAPANPEPSAEAATTGTEEAKAVEASSADAKKESPQKSPSFISKILAPFKSRIPKSPKKEKKEEAKLHEESKATETPAVEETSAEAVTEPSPPVAEVVAAEPPAAEPTADPVASDTESPKKEVKEEEKPEKRDAKQTAVKVSRRISSRVVDLFKPKKTEPSSAAKVDDVPPKIEEHTPVAPLENVGETPAPAEEPKPEVPPVAPVVVAAA